MDTASISDEHLRSALEDIRRLNRLLGSHRATKMGLGPALERCSHLRLLDVGTGSGDYLARFVHWGRHAGTRIRAVGVDCNPVTVGFARAWLDDVLPPSLRDQTRVEIGNALDLPYEDDAFDVTHASLFLHHMGGTDAVQLLREMDRVSRLGIVVNDLHRHLLAYAGIWALTRLFRMAPMVQHDGPISVRRGFLKSDLTTLAHKAGLPFPTILWHWPFRWTLSTLPNVGNEAYR